MAQTINLALRSVTKLCPAIKNPAELGRFHDLIAATNRDLKAMVEKEKFRSDLYYRLNVFPIRVPELREPKEDIPLLVRHFVQQFSRRNNRVIETIPTETMEALVRYQWPERAQIVRVLEEANGVVGGPNGAAARLGIKRTTLHVRMQKLGIHVSRTAIDGRT